MSKMAVYEGLRSEVRSAVREEIGKILTEERVPALGTHVQASRPSADHECTSSSASCPADRTMTFDEFYRKREDEDRDRFQKPPEKKSKEEETSKKPKNVEIKVGLATQVDGIEKAHRGNIQTITVSSCANRHEILHKAVSFDQTFDETLEYVLVYPDFREVIMFSLDSYKSALGKDYKKLTFYLISHKEFMAEPESDDEDSHLCTYGFSGRGCPKEAAKPKTLKSPVQVIAADDDKDE